MSSTQPRLSFEFDVDHWITGAAGFKTGWKVASRPRWERASNKMYRVSQEIVHVITGFLRGSASYDVGVLGEELSYELTYDAPYAIYEYARGGDHDYFTPAFVETEADFLDAIIGGIEADIRTWR